jgi:hypothetical protein
MYIQTHNQVCFTFVQGVAHEYRDSQPLFSFLKRVAQTYNLFVYPCKGSGSGIYRLTTYLFTFVKGAAQTRNLFDSFRVAHVNTDAPPIFKPL